MTTDPATPPVDPMPDPMPAAALGEWLFVAADAMFFAGLLSAYLVLQSTPATHALFVRSAAVVSRPLTVLAAALLLASAAAVWRAPNRPAILVGLAVAFLAVQASSVERLLDHHTIVTPNAVYDGRLAARGSLRLTGVRAPLPPTFDPAVTLPGDLRGAAPGSFGIARDDVRADVTYGPWRNNYFGCYFLVLTAHAVHVAGGLVALAWPAVRRAAGPPGSARPVALYWQFVNGVGLVATALLWVG